MSALEKALNHSENLEIDECEVVELKKNITTVRINDSEIAEIKQNFDVNYGIRIIHEKKIASIETTKQEEIPNAISNSIQNMDTLKKREFWKGLPSKSNFSEIQGIYDVKLEEISGTKAADIAENLINSTLDQKITSVTGSLNIVSENFELSNSNGLSLDEKSTYISAIINAESEKSTIPVSGIGHSSGRTLDSFSPEQVGEDAKTMCLESINPEKIDSGEYSIIFEPYSVGELLAFVIAANFNFKTFSEKKSCFTNNFQKEITVKDFSLTDDPHSVNGIGSKSFDDEGIETRSQKLIENGIFKNTYANLYDSFKENSTSTGNGLRMGSPMGRSSEPIPVSAPHNLKVENGDTSQEEMIKNTKKGILVSRLWYTYAVNPIKGDFSCTARSGIRIIKDGKIVGPGKSVRVIHNLPTMLRNISSVGNNQQNVIQWASLPSITPSIKAENIFVNSI